MKGELPIIQKLIDLIKWYVPIINKLPKNHRFALGDRITTVLYDLLEDLTEARFSKADKIARLKSINTKLQLLRYQTRILFEFALLSNRRFAHVNQLINEIGTDLGRWIKSLERQ